MSDHHAWDRGESRQKFAEEPLGGQRITVTLSQNIQYLAVLIYGPPKIMALTL
jgi:hypothetical protein